MFSEFILPGVPHPVFWTFVALAILIQGISKSGFAGGAGILSLPLMLLVMPVTKVAATLLPLLILCDMNAIYHHRHNKDWRQVMAIYLPAIAGILLGALVWYLIGKEGVGQYAKIVKRGVGVIAIIFGIYIVAKEAARHWVEQYKPGRTTAIIAGTVAGVTSTIAHAAGPIVSLYIYTQGLGKTLFVGTVAWCFTLINLTKLPFYCALGLVDTSVLTFDLTLIWLIPLGSYLGKWMHHRVPEKPFAWTICILTTISGLQLVTGYKIIERALGLFFGNV